MHGFCRFIFDDGNYYVGFYENNKKHGYGEYFYSNGKFKKGKWINGIF
jgi:hypothetical protein